MENIENNYSTSDLISNDAAELLAESIIEIDNLSADNYSGSISPAIIESEIDVTSYNDWNNDLIFSDDIFQVKNTGSTQLESNLSDVWQHKDLLTGGETVVNNQKLNWEVAENKAGQVFATGLNQALFSLSFLNSSNNVKSILDRSFGKINDLKGAKAKISELIGGNAGIEFEIVPHSELQSNGGYAQATNTVYLSQEFLEQNVNNSNVVAEVILEELGHYLDSQFNQDDTPGDEGAIFATLTLGKEIKSAELEQLRIEDDSATVKIGQQFVEIEQSEVLSLFSKSANVTGNLSAADPDNPDRNGSYSDDYQLTDVTVGDFVTVDLTSDDFDTFLQLVNADTSEVIKSDDDGGEGVNSKLTFSISQGINYVVRVTSFNSSQTGTYQLNVAATSSEDFADLTITDTNAPDVIILGDEVDISWTGINKGNSATNSYWYDNIYLSRDTILDPDGGNRRFVSPDAT